MPSTTYSLTFRGHIKKPVPEGFPEIVEQNLIVEVEGMAGLKQATEVNLVHIMRTNMGMVCRKKPDAIQSTQFVPDEQYYVPIHMIAAITTKTKMIVGAVPDETKKGNTIQ
jgi:hypothetical protein